MIYFKDYFFFNLKYINSKHQKLKLFFERNNKIEDFKLTLGNTYRNSKWTNYSVQNIKSNFINLFIYILILLLMLVLMLVYLLGKEDYNIFYSPWGLLSLVFNILVALYWELLSGVGEVLVVLYATFYVIYFVIHKYIVVELFGLVRIGVGGKPCNKFRAQSLNFFCLSKVNFLENKQLVNVLNVLYNLKFNKGGFDTVNNIFNLRSNKEHLKHLNLLNGSFVNKVNYLAISKIPNMSKPNTGVVNTVNRNYFFKETYYLGYDLPWKNYNLNTPSIYNFKYFKFFDLSFVYNLNNNFNLFSENRWFLKNSILSENLIVNSNNITDSKKLLGLNIFNSEASNLNLWLSSKNKNLSTTNLNIFIKLFYKNLYSDLTISNVNNQYLFNFFLKKNKIIHFNFFEESRFFLNKRFFFFNTLNKNFNTSLVSFKNFNNKNEYNYTNSLLFYKLYIYKYLFNTDIINNDLVGGVNKSFKNFYTNYNNLYKSNKDLYMNIYSFNFFKNSNLFFLYNLSSNESNTFKIYKPFNFTYNQPSSINKITL